MAFYGIIELNLFVLENLCLSSQKKDSMKKDTEKWAKNKLSKLSFVTFGR
jgi:hypothetical protein